MEREREFVSSNRASPLLPLIIIRGKGREKVFVDLTTKSVSINWSASVEDDDEA